MSLPELPNNQGEGDPFESMPPEVEEELMQRRERMARNLISDVRSNFPSVYINDPVRLWVEVNEVARMAGGIIHHHYADTDERIEINKLMEEDSSKK